MVQHELYMKYALNEAQAAFDDDEVPVGAVVVHEGQVIARARNQIKMLKDPTAHAEMIAITQAAAFLENERLNGCILYVTIEPCSMCVGFPFFIFFYLKRTPALSRGIPAQVSRPQPRYRG